MELGKAKGKLTTQEIMDAMEDFDFDPDQMDKLYEQLESQNIEIIDDFETAAFADLDFVLDAAEGDTAEPVAVAEGIAIDDPVKVYLKEIGRVPLFVSRGGDRSSPCGSSTGTNMRKAPVRGHLRLWVTR